MTMAWGQVSFSSTVVNFSSVYQGTPSSTTVTLTNNTLIDLVVDDIDLFHTDAFTLQDTAFIIAPGGNRVLNITCDPAHNVNYADWLLVKTSTHPEIPHVRLFAIGRYSDTYYDPSQDKYNEDLKAALRTILGTGNIQLTYNDARDKMYMIIDNKRINGQGATQNTIECVYTGYEAIGYTDRQDAQNNFNLNTEHTMPQAFFNSTLPELSDLHHLFVTTATSNSERANNPFGVVNNPNWQVGGSKSNGNLFEPRDVQKGPSIRALLYFLFRYQDYQGFICGMEPTLRAWHAQFPPDSIEQERNADIYFYQHNRNPFVDHPEFMDRITSLCSVNNGNTDPIADWVGDSLHFGAIASGNNADGYYAIANQGIDTLHLTNFNLSTTDFSVTGPGSLAIPKDSIGVIPIRFSPTTAMQYYVATLSFNTDDPAMSSLSVVVDGNSNVVGMNEMRSNGGIKVWPQPVQDRVWVELPAPARREVRLAICNLLGQEVRTTVIAKGLQQGNFALDGLPGGVYLLRIHTDKGSFSQKLIVE
jgi:hypothetical protein